MTTKAWMIGGATVLAAIVFLSGCKKPAPPTQATQAAASPTQPSQPQGLPAQGGANVFNQPNNGGVGGAGMDVKRTAYKTSAMNNLRQVAQLYNTEAISGPVDRNAFLQSLRQTLPQAYNGIQDGAYVLVSNARSAGNVVICYEKDPDSSGIHFTAFGDNSVQKLTTQQLQAALQVK